MGKILRRITSSLRVVLGGGRSFFFFLLIFYARTVCAYTIGQIVTFNNIQYRVLTASNGSYTLSAIGTTQTSGAVTIPAKVSDGKDITFTVTEMGGTGETYKFKDITSLTLPSTLTKIEYDAFNYSNLSTLTIPASVKTFSHTAFSHCTNTPVITVESGSKYFKSENGCLYSYSGKRLYAVPSSYSSAEITIDCDSVMLTSLQYIKKLTTIHFGSNVKVIESNSWPTICEGDYNLTTFDVASDNANYSSTDGVLYDKTGTKLILYPMGKTETTYKLPDKVTELSGFSIYHAQHLTKIDLNKLVKIDARAFFIDYNLTEIDIPVSVTDIAQGFIASCTNIAKYVVESGNTKYSSDDEGVLFNADKTMLYQYPTGRTDASYNIPNTVVEIGQTAFMSSKITNITIPKSVTKLNQECFRLCRNLTTVNFEEESSLKDLPTYCFWSDTKIESITLPKSLTTIKSLCFQDCSGLKNVIVPDGSQLATLEQNCFINCNLESFTFNGNSKLTTVGTGVFTNMTNLKSFELPATVTSLGKNAFRGCSNMTSFTFDAGSQLKTIDNGALADCGITSIELPSNVVTIGQDAFTNCSGLVTASIPASTTSIDAQAFNHCNKLERFIVDANNTKYSSIKGLLCDKGKTTLIDFPNAQSNPDVTLLPPSLTAIGDYAFYDCENLTNIVIPKKVTKIGKRSFGLDDKLTSIAFLCDEVINPANIDQSLNETAIDESMYKNITLYVRKDLYDEYTSGTYKDYYGKFKAIRTSFKVAHSGDKQNQTDCDEYRPLSDRSVELLSTKADVNTFVADGKVVSPDDGITRSVNLIGDYAFENSTVKEVVMLKNIYYLGAMAFVTKTERTTANGVTTVKPVSSTIQNIFFCGKQAPTTLATVDYELGDNYNEFLSGQNIYVKKSLLGDFQTAWAGKSYVKQLSYKIPGADITNEYVSFSREFDVDLSDFESNNPVYAFIGTDSKIYSGGGDYGTATNHIKMTSIQTSGTDDNGNSVSYDGTYIPAGTGVLLKVWNSDQTATPSDFYYRIGELDLNTAQDNLMKPVTVNAATLDGSKYDYWLMSKSKGVFQQIDPNNSAFNLAIHKAYLQFDKNSAAKLAFEFNEQPTDIKQIKTVREIKTPYYNLNGIVVPHPQHGIYIHNGDKIILK